MTDIITVTKKEIKEIFFSKNIWQTYGIIFFWALFFAYLFRDNNIMGILMFGFLISFALGSTISRELLIGERERNTLESLLSTRLPDYAIVFGKILAVIMVSYIITFLSMAVEILILKKIFNTVFVIDPYILPMFFILPLVFISYISICGFLVSILIRDNRSVSLVLIAFTIIPIFLGKTIIKNYQIPLNLNLILILSALSIIISCLLLVLCLFLFKRDFLLKENYS